MSFQKIVSQIRTLPSRWVTPRTTGAEPTRQIALWAKALPFSLFLYARAFVSYLCCCAPLQGSFIIPSKMRCQKYCNTTILSKPYKAKPLSINHYYSTNYLVHNLMLHLINISYTTRAPYVLLLYALALTRLDYRSDPAVLPTMQPLLPPQLELDFLDYS